MRRQFIYIYSLSLIFSLLCTMAPDAIAEGLGHPTTLIPMIRRTSQTLVEDHRLMNSTLILGLADETSGADRYICPAQDDRRTDPCGSRLASFYEIASLSKIFTGVLLAHAVLEKPKFTLDTSIGSVITELQGTSVGQATLRQLATHRSGLPLSASAAILEDSGNPYSVSDASILLKEAARMRIEAGPSPKVYSDLGFAVLGIALERIYGETYLELVRKKITTPLEMKDTDGTQTNSLRKRMIKGHDIALQPMKPGSFGAHVAAAGLVSTPLDMARFLDAFRDPPSSLLGTAIRMSADEGLGWDSDPKAPALFKDAGSTGFSAWIYIERETHKGILALNGVASSRSEEILWSLLEGKEPSPLVRPGLPKALLGKFFALDASKKVLEVNDSGPVPFLTLPDGMRLRILSHGDRNIWVDDGWSKPFFLSYDCEGQRCTISSDLGKSKVDFGR